jgi:predicted transcriptional regulator
MISKLIAAIEVYQKCFNLSNRAFAQKIGVDPAVITRVKHKTDNPGTKFLSGILQNIPELQGIVIEYMSTKDKNG